MSAKEKPSIRIVLVIDDVQEFEKQLNALIEEGYGILTVDAFIGRFNQIILFATCELIKKKK